MVSILQIRLSEYLVDLNWSSMAVSMEMRLSSSRLVPTLVEAVHQVVLWREFSWITLLEYSQIHHHSWVTFSSNIIWQKWLRCNSILWFLKSPFIKRVGIFCISSPLEEWRSRGGATQRKSSEWNESDILYPSFRPSGDQLQQYRESYRRDDSWISSVRISYKQRKILNQAQDDRILGFLLGHPDENQGLPSLFTQIGNHKSHSRDEPWIFCFSCFLYLFPYNPLAPIPLGVGDLLW